eukprot:scaffold144790_cov36-Tisochrysis_lutea.AAC.1
MGNFIFWTEAKIDGDAVGAKALCAHAPPRARHGAAEGRRPAAAWRPHWRRLSVAKQAGPGE